MSLKFSNIEILIKAEAHRIGFDACGIAKADFAGEHADYFRQWIRANHHASMTYMENNESKRLDPRLLVEQAQSIVVVALNYYPTQLQPENHPQFAYYAYGKDYHEVMKEKLSALFNYMVGLNEGVSGRCFCDTAPVLERYWAEKAGIGFIGKNTQLILPHKGSYFFLGEIISSLPLVADKPLVNRCGSCNRCLEACPTKALESPHRLNASRCLSFQTIENKGELSPEVLRKIGNRVYGCDTCQQVCPHNRFATPNNNTELAPSESFLSLDYQTLKQLSPLQYSSLFCHSAVKRVKYNELMRNIRALPPSEYTLKSITSKSKK